VSQRFNLSDWTLHHRTLVGYFLLAIALMGVIAYGRLARPKTRPSPSRSWSSAACGRAPRRTRWNSR
jgi:hypothetical protein